MSTRSVIARKTGNGFSGVYHHWDGYPSGVGKTLFEVRQSIFAGDTKRMLEYLIDLHPGGWSTINKDWSLPEGHRPDTDEEICETCGKPSWMHYRQYYHASYTAKPSAWERAGRPTLPEGDEIMVLGHGCKAKEPEIGPEPFEGKGGKVTHRNAAGSGCEWAYVFDGNGKMEIQSSRCASGEKMIGAFGSGDPDASWHKVGVVLLDGPEPNWEDLDKKG